MQPQQDLSGPQPLCWPGSQTVFGSFRALGWVNNRAAKVGIWQAQLVKGQVLG